MMLQAPRKRKTNIFFFILVNSVAYKANLFCYFSKYLKLVWEISRCEMWKTLVTQKKQQAITMP
jgi:hypothetical protein